MAKTRVAVLFGGATKDHRISLKSAYSVLNGLSPERFEVTPIGITRAGRWLYFPGDYSEIRDGTWEQNSDCCSAIISPDPLHKGIITIMADNSMTFKRIDVVFTVLHGKYGECGRVQGLLKLSKIPYTDCSPDTAAICVDKGLTHLVLSNSGIDVPKYALLERGEINVIDERIEEIEKEISYPMYVSATSCSSSIGASVVRNAAELRAAAKIAFSHHHTAIVEEELSGKTVDCVVLGNSYETEVTALGQIVKTHFSDKSFVSYTAGFTTDTDITAEQREIIKATAVKAFKILNFKGMASMSFRISGDRVMLRRVHNIPGFTEESALPILMGESGYSYPDALERLISLAREIDS